MAFSSEPLPTPGFLTAAIQGNDENIFENAFSKDNHSSNPQTPSFDSPHHDTNYFEPVNSGRYPIGYTPHDEYAPRDFLFSQQQPKVNLNGWSFDEKETGKHQYPDPSILPSNASPPPSHPASPNFSFQGYRSEATVPSSLQTANIGIDPRIQYGQITPPDDNGIDNGNVTNHTFDRRMSQASLSSSSTHQPSLKRKLTFVEESPIPEAVTKSFKKSRSRSKKGDSNAASTENNEKDEKRSKFLERNRVAASKCRQKKKEWTSALEARARDLQQDRVHLQNLVEEMKAEVMYLKNQMLLHTQCGSSNIRDYLAREATAIARGDAGYSPDALARRREVAHGQITTSDGKAPSRRASVVSGMTNEGTTENDEESVIGGDGDGQMGHAS